MHNSVKEKMIAATGANESELESVATPFGQVLYGLPCLRGDVSGMQVALRNAFQDTGFRAFLTHESPREWEWEDRCNPVQLSDSAGSRIAEIVASRFGSDATDRLNPSTVARERVFDSPEEGEDVLSSFFSRPPGWVCLVDAGYSYNLPLILQAPNSVNWVGGLEGDSLDFVSHARVLREWNSRYGLEVDYVGANSLAVRLERPPRTESEIALVAVEQYAYCPDLFQVYGDVEDVANEQAGSKRWFFWWD